MSIKARSKILYVCPTQGVYGGMEIATLKQAIWMQENEPHIEVEIYFKLLSGYTAQKEFLEILNNAPIHCCLAKGYSLKLFEKINNAHLIHLQNVPIDAALMSSIFNKPFIATIYHQGQTPHLGLKLAWRLFSLIAKYRIFISNFVYKKWITGFLAFKTQKDHCWSALPNFPTHIPIASPRKGFIFISRWIKNKGIEELLQAYKLANIQHKDWPLKMIGTGPLVEYVQSFTQEHELFTVEICGFVQEQKKWDLIAQSKWLIAPPKTNEDLGLTPIEARYLGVPSIVTKDGGLVEAAGVFSLKCQPGNIYELKRLLEFAANMDDTCYLNFCKNTKLDLKDFLTPLYDYATLYTSILDDFMII